jgi:hypothetical protein
MQPFNMHSIGVATCALSKTVIGQSFNPQMSTLSIGLKILDLGTYDETFTLTVCANSTLIAQQSVSLSQEDYTSLNVTWNTADCAMGNYTITASVELAQGETNTAKSTLSGGNVFVSIPGDINGDGTVNILDAILLSNAFLSTPKSANWNPNADINGDGVINILDAIIMSNNFGAKVS